MQNRKGYDLLFIDIDTGELIIGEVKSSISDTLNESYTNTLNMAKKSLIENDSSYKKITLNNFVKKDFNIFKLIDYPFSDSENLKLDKIAQTNFREAVRSILNYINNVNNQSKNKDLNYLKNISVIIVSWLGTKNNNFNDFNAIDKNSHFNKRINNNFILENHKTHNYIFWSLLSDIDYYNLYLQIEKKFNQEDSKLI